VINTLDSVVDALAKDPARKFVVVEQVPLPRVITFFSLEPSNRYRSIPHAADRHCLRSHPRLNAQCPQAMIFHFGLLYYCYAKE
jgi:hypothetical protein